MLVQLPQQELNMSSIHNQLNLTSIFSRNLKHLPGIDVVLPKHGICSTRTDVLALACTWHNLRVHKINNQISSLYSPELENYHMDIHSEWARDIREYYSRKIVLWNLQGKELTNFRKALLELISGDGKETPHPLLPIAYKLPEFHLHDMQLDALWSTVFTNNPAPEYEGFTSHSLVPVKKISRKTKYSDQAAYYFTISGTDTAAVITLKKDKNVLPLQAIWDCLFDSGKPVQINGTYRARMNSEHNHYAVDGWNLVNGLKVVDV